MIRASLRHCRAGRSHGSFSRADNERSSNSLSPRFPYWVHTPGASREALRGRPALLTGRALGIGVARGPFPSLPTGADGISFTVERGEALILVGPNGAGKTSVKCRLGLRYPTSSSEGQPYKLDGIDPGNLRSPPHFARGRRAGGRRQNPPLRRPAYSPAQSAQSPSGR
ncbi:ATP-binding cassette domain-containing protein [Thermus brevis]|uniref:ATP-binding cassette domain-containing protein n=1 Tax=Thermus brevis TaxID=2862456 RepID=UPI0031BA41BD